MGDVTKILSFWMPIDCGERGGGGEAGLKEKKGGGCKRGVRRGRGVCTDGGREGRKNEGG